MSKPAPSRVMRLLIRTALAAHGVLLRLVGRFGRVPRQTDAGGVDILLTGTFHSANWIKAHIAPLAGARRCRSITIVGSADVSGVAKVAVVNVPAWLRRTIGGVPARLLVFWVLALRRRPHVVGGFHLLVNGLAVPLVARTSGARGWYFCVGGPREALDGGVHQENPYFARIGVPDAVIERRLLDAVRACDLVVTMGTSAAEYFAGHGVRRCEVIAGGIEAERFQRSGAAPDYDLLVAARLVPIKRLDRFVDVVRVLATGRRDLRAVIVGDGPLRRDLEAQSARLGLQDHLLFAGTQADVGAWLARARVFMLTSESEGLSLAIMEAMTCGLPVVAPRIGDLADLVEDGVNGFLVATPEIPLLADAARRLLDHPDALARFSAAAERTARRYHLPAAIEKWDNVLAESAVSV
jgi:glycosyltransferase involved in cell wall biosynthesis